MDATEAGSRFFGRVVWLTPEQGGRANGPPMPSTSPGFAHTAFVPPQTLETGLASFVLKGFDAGAWNSPAEGHWLLVDNEGAQRIETGAVVVCTDGPRVIAYFHVEGVTDAQQV